MASSRTGPGEFPNWLKDTFRWGPHRWPRFWCELQPDSDQDCGVFAELARISLRSAGAKVAPVQLWETFPVDTIAEWSQRWRLAEADASWCGGDEAYHEAVGILDGVGLEIYDPLDCVLRTPDGAYGGIRRVRVAPTEELPSGTKLNWTGIDVTVGDWTLLRPSEVRPPLDFSYLHGRSPDLPQVAALFRQGWSEICVDAPELRSLHREATALHQSSTSALYVALNSGDRQSVETSLKAHLNERGVLCVVASIHQEVAGAILAHAVPLSDADNSTAVGFIDLAAVRQESRKCGIGRALVEHLLEEMRARRCVAVYGELMVAHARAAAFWRSVGMEDLYVVQRQVLLR